MTKQEFANIAVAIKAAYPNSNAIPDNAAMDLWYKMLYELDYLIVQNAVLEHISTNKFPPSIAEIREKCTTYTSLPVKDWGESWESVLLSIRKFGYMQENEALENLDEVTRKCVKRLGYQNICMSENITADRANFRMIYEQEANRLKTNNQLPKFLITEKHKLIQTLTDRTLAALEDKKEKNPEREIEDHKTASPEYIDKLFESHGLRKPYDRS